jgi:hypothetical protein
LYEKEPMTQRSPVLSLALGIALPFFAWLLFRSLLRAFGDTAIGYCFAGWLLLNIFALFLMLSASTRMYRYHLGASAANATLAKYVRYGLVVLATLLCWVFLTVVSYALLIYLIRDFAPA